MKYYAEYLKKQKIVTVFHFYIGLPLGLWTCKRYYQTREINNIYVFSL